MSTEPRSPSSSVALPYEPQPSAEDLRYWNLFRLGLIVWAACVLIRHATYWGGTLISMGGFSGMAGVDTRALVFAGMETILLALLLTVAVCAKGKGPTRQTLLAMASLSALLILLVLTGLIFDLAAAGQWRMPVRAVWMAVSRLQWLVLPLMAIVAAARQRSVARR